MKELYNNHVGSNDDKREGVKRLKSNPIFVKSMCMLDAADVAEVKCDGEKASCLVCANPNCDKILVRERARSDNLSFCRKCSEQCRLGELHKKRRNKNFYKQLANNSKINLKWLTNEEKIKRMRILRERKKEEVGSLIQEKERLTHANSSLVQDNEGLHYSRLSLMQDKESLEQENATLRMQLHEALSKKVNLLDDPGSNALDFLSCVEFMLDALLADEKNLRSNLTKMMSGVMKGIVRKDGKKQGKAKKRKDNCNKKSEEALVDVVVEAMFNTSLELNGKKNQCSYSPVIFQMVQSVWNTSASAHKNLCNLMPFSIPSARLMQQNTKAAFIADGRNPKPYQQRQATKDGRGKWREVGYLQCDEMKLKHGIYWNTQTGEAVGLADDMLDMDSVIRRVLSDGGDEPKAAVYVNQWQYVSFNPEGLETWYCEHFFNDGSLTGTTLARQYNQVLRSCEAIESEVYGLVLDAGGSNSKFVRGEMLDELKAMKHNPWISEEQCVATNVASKDKRKVYFWFCSTHVFKAMRGQLFTSRPGGKKAFKSASGVPFGWLPAKLLVWLEADKANTGGKVSQRVRLSSKSANPKNQLKMSVSLAKIPFEHSTIVYAITKCSSQLGITPEALEEATKEARMKHPFRRLISGTERGEKSKEEIEEEAADLAVDKVPTLATSPLHGSNIHHCHNLEKILYLQKVARERAGTLQEMETELAFVNEEEEDECGDESFDELYDRLHPHDADDDCEVDELQGAQQGDVMPNLLSDLESLVYMGHIEALFHDFILNKREKLTAGNIDTYEKHAKDLLQYFGDWKASQLKRRDLRDSDWEKSFMAPQTYKNLRICVGGFFHFARYLLNEVFPGEEGLTFIAMLSANQSFLEGKFGCQRLTGHDKGNTYSKGITTVMQKSATVALAGKGYDINDCAKISEDTNVTALGSAFFVKHLHSAETKLSELKEQRSKNSKQWSKVSLSRFGLENKSAARPGGLVDHTAAPGGAHAAATRQEVRADRAAAPGSAAATRG